MSARAVWILLATLGLLVLAVTSLGVGAVSIAPRDVLHILLDFSDSEAPSTDTIIVWQLRLPRVLLACFVGAGLGMAGASYQGLFRNPLADPFVIGASSGAALGATLAFVFGLQQTSLGTAIVPAAALVGALLAVATVYSIASAGRQQVPMLSLLLSGIAVSSFIGALVSLLMFLHEEQLATIVGWLMGSLSHGGWPVLQPTALLVVAGGLLLWLLSRSLDALTFGEETAATLGLSVTRLRGLVVLAASLTTAASVAAGGVIGFVGLVAPHLARSLVGPRHAGVIPASGLLGAILLLLADDCARTLVAPTELPVGILTALLGSPFFLYFLKFRTRESGMKA